VPLAAIVAPLNVITPVALVVVKVPPHTVVLESATVTPAGSVSVNPTPVSATVEFGLVIVKVRVLVPFTGMFVGLNDLAIEGGATTVIVADAVLPCAVSFEVTFPLVLFFTPAVVPFTSTFTVQVPLAAIEPPLKVSVVSPAAGVKVPVQVLLAFGVAATSSPAGKLSVNATPVRAVVVFGLVMVNVSVAVPPSGIVAALKDLLICTGPITVNVAVFEVAPAPLSFELIAPLVFIHTPVVEPVTVTLKLQLLLPPVPSVPPVNEIVPGAVVETVPPHAAVGPEVATVSPAGSVSVKLIPVRLIDEFGLVIVKVRLVVAPSSTLEAPNDLVSVGGEATVTDAVLLVVPVPPLLDVTAPVVLFLTPDVVPVTVTLNMQFPLAAIDAPASEITPVALVVVNVPPH